MVSPLRKNDLTCTADDSINGIFVIGRSNARGLDIPHLPRIIQSNGSCAGLSMAVAGEEDVQPINLKCDDLFDNYSEGDIVRINSRINKVQSVLSSRSTANTLLVTEQCENRCLFCSQPPNSYEDTFLYHEATLALLNFNSCDFIGLSGGEPTHNENAFVTLLSTLKQFRNPTKLHILSNGRRHKGIGFVKQVAELVDDRDVLWGIPLYGHYADLHDHLVGDSGAFIDTAQGLSNLTSQNQHVELRIVPVAENLMYLQNIIEFISSNYLNLQIVSVMNLEPKGYAHKNYDSLHVDVVQQVPYLEHAVEAAERYGLKICLFNYPLCLLSEQLRTWAVQSISDWKNYYTEECVGCMLQTQCGGFFTSSKGRFLEKIRRIT